MEAAKLSGLPDGENFTMANFTYANSAVVSRMFAHLHNTSFPGISVSIFCMCKMMLKMIHTFFRETKSVLTHMALESLIKSQSFNIN